MSAQAEANPEMPVARSAHRAHPADVAVFVITTTLCALGALILPLAG